MHHGTSRFFCLWLALGALLLGGCGKKFPAPWDQLGLPTDHMTSAFSDTDKPAVTALYQPSIQLDAMVTRWDATLGGKGFRSFCELKHPDGSLNRGYENAEAKKRYLFTGSKVGAAPELRLLEVPPQIANSEVCPKKSGG